MAKRDSFVRVDERDLSALKAARDKIDDSLALGAVARMGAQRLLQEENAAEGVRF